MKLLNKSIIAAVMALSALAMSCSSKLDGGSTTGVLILSKLVQSSSTGNCAVSIDLNALYYGAIVNNAVAATVSAANLTAVTTADANKFDKLDYQDATGETVTDAQWTSTTFDTTNGTTIGYNKRYDAFFTNKGSIWTDATRTTALDTAKSYIDSAALLGGLGTIVNDLGGPTAACSTKNADLLTKYDALVTTINNTTKVDGVNGLPTIAPTLLAGGLMSSLGATTGLATATALTPTVITSSALKTNITLGATNCGTLTTVYSNAAILAKTSPAYTNMLADRNGLALMACGRIPRSSCNFGSITTADLTTAKASQAKVYDAIANNGACRKTDVEFMNKSVLPLVASGLKNGDTIEKFTTRPKLTGGDNLNNSTVSLEVSTSYPFGGTPDSATPQSLFADKAYPVASALTAVNASLGLAFPMNDATTTATAYSAAKFYRDGSNIGFQQIDSCAAIGLGIGPVPTPTLSTSRRNLTSPAEIVYALSTQNAAAKVYYTAMGGMSLDAYACNVNFRANTSIPVSLNEKLQVIQTPYGDGDATSLLSSCMYGKDSDTVKLGVSYFGKGSLSGLAACPGPGVSATSPNAVTGATKFSNITIDSTKFPYSK